jgi:hypothetical protein
MEPTKDFAEIEKIQKTLLQSLDVIIGKTYKHYKGGLYIVENVVMSESSLELVVVYRSKLHPLPIPWGRPLKEWNEIVVILDGIFDHRFTLVDE